MSSYCDFAAGHPLHGPYHDSEYGFPVSDDNALFERLLLEINQAGLSWDLMLRKRDTMRVAYDNFDIDKVAAYDESDRERLLANAGIIRNKLKVNAAIENARRLITFREEFGSFADWLAAQHPRSKDDWVKLFKKNFKFTGGEITGEFLMGIGYLPGAHREDCAVFAVIQKAQPPWMQSA